MAGCSLDEIGMLLGNGQQPELDKALLAAKAEELARVIRQLEALKSGLEHAANCPAPSHMECPSFRRMLKSASARTGRSRASRSPKCDPAKSGLK